MFVPRQFPGPAAAAIFMVGIVAFYVWTPDSFHARWLAPQATSHYHELTDGFLAGHLHVARAVDPRLAALPDPYDPVANAPYRVNDLSYSAGKYYFYPSAVPVLLLFAPIKLLTGSHLTESGACAVFAVAGLGAALVFLFTLYRRVFPDASALLVAGAMVALALCHGYYVVLRSESYNLVPIACAYFWVMLALLALLHALLAASRGSRLRWLAAGSLAYGLAIASRPNYLPGAVTLLVPVALWWRADGWRLSRSFVSQLLALGLPLAGIGVGLLAYNYARFGRVTEFGMGLQLGAWDQRSMSGLSLGNVPENAWHYLIGPGLYHATFPFVTGSYWTSLGVLWHAPLILLSLLFLPLRRWLPESSRAALLLPLLVAATNLAFLMLFPSGNPAAVHTSANARYLFDFLPSWILLSAGTVLAAAHAWQSRPARLRLLQIVAALLLVISTLAALSLDFSRFPREAYRPVARLLSQPAWWWEKVRGIKYGSLEVEVLLPVDKTGAYEPLLTTGTALEGDLLFVFYESPQSIRLGLVGTGAPGPLSGSIAVDYAAKHRLEFHLGPLYPDLSHPLMADYDVAQVAQLIRQLLVRLDGRTVLDLPVHYHTTQPGPVSLGKASFLLDYSTGRFTGRILAERRLPLPAPIAAVPMAEYGALRMELKFPTDRNGRTEPLVSTGIPRAGDLLAVAYHDDKAVRFLFDHWGHPGTATDWIPMDFSLPHTLEITVGSLLHPSGHPLMAGLPLQERQRAQDQLQVRLDGRIVLDVIQPTYVSSPYDVFVGRNLIGSSTAEPSFTGTILRSERLPLAGR